MSERKSDSLAPRLGDNALPVSRSARKTSSQVAAVDAATGSTSCARFTSVYPFLSSLYKASSVAVLFAQASTCLRLPLRSSRGRTSHSPTTLAPPPHLSSVVEAEQHRLLLEAHPCPRSRQQLHTLRSILVHGEYSLQRTR